MALHLPPHQLLRQPQNEDEDGYISSLDDDDEDNVFDDWISDGIVLRETWSLFDGQNFPSVDDALSHDKTVHGFDLLDFARNLSLDFYGRARLINYIRKNEISPEEVILLTGKESLFLDDEYLTPALENDPLLQAATDDWSDPDDSETDPLVAGDPSRRAQALERKLAAAVQNLEDYKSMFSHKLDLAGVTAESASDPLPAPTRDDDSHYFASYAENDIHLVMIQDKVRTSTYAHFILTTPDLFQDAVVLDVGCGTGILSLFAARAGAKRVYAVDASPIASKARQIVHDNGLDNIITVVQGKIEDIELPGIENFGGKVDVIISEWMGYALLYESMLDSVLCARDRWLNEGRVMAPSQCQMMLGLCDAGDILKDRIGFWDDVYGFDMSTMAHDLYDEAVVDIVGPNTLLSAPCVIKDLLLSRIIPSNLSFHAPFTLISNAIQRTRLSAFILYFDTFFTSTGEPVPEGTIPKILKEEDAMVAEVWPVGGRNARERSQSLGRSRRKSLKGKEKEGVKEKENHKVEETRIETPEITSFSTGPESVSTHWKQTFFMLREPVFIVEGSIVSGVFFCRKSDSNSRELDVEIHYSVQRDCHSEPTETVVQMYKIR